MRKLTVWMWLTGGLATACVLLIHIGIITNFDIPGTTGELIGGAIGLTFILSLTASWAIGLEIDDRNRRQNSCPALAPRSKT